MDGGTVASVVVAGGAACKMGTPPGEVSCVGYTMEVSVYHRQLRAKLVARWARAQVDWMATTQMAMG